MRKLTLQIGFALALGASVTGCAVGPNYQRPSVKLQPFHNAPPIETRTASLPAPPLDQWWTGFHDPELTRIVQRALDQNLDLAAAMARVQQARAAARGAGAQRLPAGNINASTTTLYQSTESMTGRLASNLPGYSRTQNYYDLGLMASWETDLFTYVWMERSTISRRSGTHRLSQAGAPVVPQLEDVLIDIPGRRLDPSGQIYIVRDSGVAELLSSLEGPVKHVLTEFDWLAKRIRVFVSPRIDPGESVSTLAFREGMIEAMYKTLLPARASQVR